MKKTALFRPVLLTLLLGASAWAAFIPGHRQFRYFMTVPEVKEILFSNQFTPADLTETYGELCLYPHVTQDFTAFERRGRQFYSCQFTTNVRELIKTMGGKLLHLTSRNARDFIQLSVPANRTTNDYRDWDHQYLFYNNPAGAAHGIITNTHQLFAIVLTYRGIDIEGEWRFLRPGSWALVEGELRSQFGLPDLVDLNVFDRVTQIMRQTYRHTFYGGNTTDFRIDMQVNASWGRYGPREANLQLTYMTEQFSSLFLINLTRGVYEVPSLEWSLLIGGREAMLKAGRVYGENQPSAR